MLFWVWFEVQILTFKSLNGPHLGISFHLWECFLSYVPPPILTWVLLFHNISLCVIKKTKKRRVLVPPLWNSFIPKATLILSLHSCHRQSEIWLDGFSTGFHLLLKKQQQHIFMAGFYARFCMPHFSGIHITLGVILLKRSLGIIMIIITLVLVVLTTPTTTTTANTPTLTMCSLLKGLWFNSRIIILHGRKIPVKLLASHAKENVRKKISLSKSLEGPSQSQ